MSSAPPGSAEWHNDRGNALCDEFRFREAIAEYERALALRPDYGAAFSNLGAALRDLGRIDEAISAHRRALEYQPDLAEAWNNLAIALRDNGQWDEALPCCRRALEIKPLYADAHANLGVILCEIEEPDEAIAACRRAVEIQPRRGVLQNNLGMILLRLGHYEEGWARIEARYASDPRFPARVLLKPRWDGGDLRGRTLLIHAEQGFGDTMQFARYVPLAAERGGKVIFECQPELRGLFECLKGVQVVMAGEALPAFDVHCPIMSLPLAFGTTLQTVPAEPYLRPDAKHVEFWRRELDWRSGTPHIHAGLRKTRIGLVWAGKPTHTDDRNRSMTLHELASLAEINATFFSMQKGPAASQISAAPRGLHLIDFTQQFTDFAETAAFIAHLDLVIAVDTAVAHLAGAMGKPVYLLLPKIADWRWMIQRSDTPWYPTMRLFRQTHWRDWKEPVERIVASLHHREEF